MEKGSKNLPIVSKGAKQTNSLLFKVNMLSICKLTRETIKRVIFGHEKIIETTI